MNNILNLEERITCNKIKSKAKTLLFGQLILNEHISNEHITNTIQFSNIKINLINSNNIELIKSLLIDSTIIISTSSNPKSSHSHILVLPGFLSEILNISPNSFELNIFFNNFFSNNIPINMTNLYFMIWFKKIIPHNIITKSSINYCLNKLELTDKNTISIPDIYTSEYKYFMVQQTQTFNISYNKPNKISNTYFEIIKKCNFENMCRGFWIKMTLYDYNNLKKIKLLLNGHNRFELRKEQIELMDIKKNISNNFVLIFINLEFGNIQWNLPSTIDEIKHIYSNSLNCSRIDIINFLFGFENNFVSSNIQISALTLNLLHSRTNHILYKYFN